MHSAVARLYYGWWCRRQGALRPHALAVLALGVGGGWNPEAAQFVRLLARCRARAMARPLLFATIAAFTSRWYALLAFCAARAFGASLLDLSFAGAANVDGDQPLLTEPSTSCPPPPVSCSPDLGVEDADVVKTV